MESFSINIDQTDNATVVSLVGMADMLIVDKLDSAFNDIITSHDNHIIVDLSELGFICSIGLSSLIKAHRKCIKENKKFVLAGTPVMIERLLSTTQLDSFFMVYDCLETALAELDK